jgi:hypothetical protein
MNHVIRLRGPWTWQVLHRLPDSASPLASEGKQSLPADWSKAVGAGFRGTVAYQRVFHRPTGLEADQQVWLNLAGVVSSAIVTLNQMQLGGVEAVGGRFAVESLLEETNLLTVAVHHESGPNVGGLTGLVTLEIETVRPRPID